MTKFRSLSAALMALSLVFISACSPQNKPEESDVLKVGMECGYPPFNWTQLDDSNGAVKIDGTTNEYANGYDVQIAKKVADALNKKLVIVKTEWDGLIPAVNSGIIDAVMAGMSPTDERKEVVDFSQPYYDSEFVVVVKKGGAYENAKTLADLKDAKITGQLNTFHYTVIDQIPEVKKLDAMVDFPTMRVALQSGVIDGYISEKPEAVSAVKALSDLTFVEFAQGNGFEASEADKAIAAALKKGSPLKETIDQTLSNISPEERNQIMQDAISHQNISE